MAQAQCGPIQSHSPIYLQHKYSSSKCIHVGLPVTRVLLDTRGHLRPSATLHRPSAHVTHGLLPGAEGSEEQPHNSPRFIDSSRRACPQSAPSGLIPASGLKAAVPVASAGRMLHGSLAASRVVQREIYQMPSGDLAVHALLKPPS